MTEPEPIRWLADEAVRSGSEPWQALPVAVIYKHSPACGISAAALREVQAFGAANPDLPIFGVDVILQRGVSQRIAGALGVPHASPQVIVVAGGRAVHTESHFRITQSALAEALRAAGATRPPVEALERG